MVTVHESEARRASNITKMVAQVATWKSEIDRHELLGRSRHKLPAESAHEAEELELQISRVRVRLRSVSIRLEEFRVAPTDSAPWGNFRAGIADEWTTLETGVRNLAHGARRVERNTTPLPSAGAESPTTPAPPPSAAK